LSAVVILITSKLNLNIIKDIYSSPQSPPIKIIFSINLLSLGGLPPFLGFYAKASAIIISVTYFSG
jgi:NADH:ubiquinone oxidoreductase subunit 2 (subunit N)